MFSSRSREGWVLPIKFVVMQWWNITNHATLMIESCSFNCIIVWDAFPLICFVLSVFCKGPPSSTSAQMGVSKNWLSMLVISSWDQSSDAFTNFHSCIAGYFILGPILRCLYKLSFMQRYHVVVVLCRRIHVYCTKKPALYNTLKNNQLSFPKGRGGTYTGAAPGANRRKGGIQTLTL